MGHAKTIGIALGAIFCAWSGICGQTLPSLQMGKELCRTPELSITPVNPSDNEMGVDYGALQGPYLTAHAVTLPYLLQIAFQMRAARFDLRAQLPQGNFDVSLPADPMPKERMAFPVVQLAKAFHEAFGLSLRVETQDREVLVLSAPGDAMPSGLAASGPNEKESEATVDAGYLVKNGTMNSLCDKLEVATGEPVVNETGLRGGYDYLLAHSLRSAADKDAAIKLVKNLGLDVTTAHRKIEMLVVEREQEGSAAKSGKD